ncbi:MAG: hypothetical protein QF492_09085, partial [Candidatus Krumholzibacteria bacterium]|nr:hypothetical protein [Candidatus Krumholzibacteria bacterium]
TKTILFSTHILQEVAPVTDRVVIVNQGRIVADGRIGDLQREAMKSNRIFIAFEQVPGDLVTGLEAQEGIERVSALDSNRFEVRGSFDTDLPGLLSKIARKENWELRELNESPYSLEDTFIELTRDDGEVRA